MRRYLLAVLFLVACGPETLPYTPGTLGGASPPGGTQLPVCALLDPDAGVDGGYDAGPLCYVPPPPRPDAGADGGIDGGVDGGP